MKKFMSVLLAAALALSLGVTAMAVGEGTPENSGIATVKFQKDFELTSTTAGDSPAVTFEFIPTEKGYLSFGSTDYTTEDIPDLTYTADTGVTGVTFPSANTSGNIEIKYDKRELNDAASKPVTKTFTINLPQYTKLGKYCYSFTEKETNVSNVGNDEVSTIYLYVTVTRDLSDGAADGTLKRTVSIHKGTSTKENSIHFVNTFPAKDLSISKMVAGDAGDFGAEFDVTLTLINTATGMTIGNDIILYSDVKNLVIGKIEAGGNHWNNNTETIKFKIMHGETVTVKGIPDNVQFTVKEEDYSTIGYTTTYSSTEATLDSPVLPAASELVHDTDGVTGTMNGKPWAITITNTRGEIPETGITLDSLPYLVLMGGVAVGLFIVLLAKRKREDED